MSGSNYNYYRTLSASSKKVMLAVVAAVVAAVIIGGLICARNYSGNDTSSAVTNTPSADPAQRP